MASSSGHAVPSINSESFTTPTATTRALVYERDNYRCWLCGGTVRILLNIAHQLPAGSIERFSYFSSKGVLPQSLTHLAHPDNLIILCTACHPTYHCASPYWVMLPTSATLDQYIQHECNDFEERRRAGEVGQDQPRTLPHINKTMVQYQPYLLDPTFAKGGPTLRPSQWPKLWGGEPTAAILKALHGAFQPCERELVTAEGGEQIQLGIPDRTLQQCSELVRLWNRPPPLVRDIQQEPPKKKREHSPGEQKRGQGDGSGGWRVVEGRRRKGQGAKPPFTSGSHRQLRSGGQVEDEGSLKEEGATEQEFFTLGPGSTANDVMNLILGVRGIEPRRD